MQQITAFKTSDGKIFETVEEVQAHELALMWGSRIDAFLKSPHCPYPGPAQRGIATKTVMAWEAYKVEQITQDRANAQKGTTP